MKKADREFAVLKLEENTAGRIFMFKRRGNSSTKRAAIFSGSRPSNGTSCCATINADRFLIAISMGSFASLSASAQGSRSRRASAETTLR